MDGICNCGIGMEWNRVKWYWNEIVLELEQSSIGMNSIRMEWYWNEMVLEWSNIGMELEWSGIGMKNEIVLECRSGTGMRYNL